MTIFYNDTSLDIEVNDNSYRYRAIKGEHSLTLYFSLPQHIELPVGAYCNFQAETYTLETPENFKMLNSRNFEYTVVFESSQAKAKKYKFRNPVDRRLKFSFTAKPREHLQMFIDNMNARDRGWSIGECMDAPEKPISYSHVFCMDALIQQAEAFETEYEFIGKQVSLRKVEYNKDNPLPLSYGRGNGFKPGVGRTNFNDSKAIEILFVQGGEQNIDASKYKSQELLLPRSQTLRYDGRCFEGQTGFNTSDARTYISDRDGFSIQRQDKPLRSNEEDSLDLSHIYPSRVGTVTAAVVVSDEKGFYDMIDSTIPQDLDFSKYIIEGESMSVIFQSGMLAGKEFEVKYHHEAKTVNGVAKDARRFEIVPQEVDGQTMPNEIFAPQTDNKYAVFGIALPDAYVCDNTTRSGASWDLFREAAKYLYENEQQKFTFTGELDGIWAKKDWLNIGGRIRLGGYVLFSDPQFQPDGVGIRIVGIKDYINNPHSPEIELSNSVVGSSIMSDIRNIENNEVVADSRHKAALQFTKRRFRDSQETITALEEAMDANFSSFSDSINPIAVKTMSMLVGEESLQFVFVKNSSSVVEIPHTVTYDQQAHQLSLPGGFLQHKTLGIDRVSPSHKAGEYKTWSLPSYLSAVLTEARQKYYAYAKVSKTAKTGEFLINPVPIAIEGENGYYHLLVGILNSEFEGERNYVSLHGYTEILPGRITVNRIVSTDGNTYFDLAQNRIGGRISFESGSSGLENLDEWSDVEQKIDEAQTTANNAKEASDATTKQLTDWASDSMISPTEKTALKQQRSDMQSEYAEVLTNADKYSVSTKNYTDAYAAAITAFAKYTATTPESVLIEAGYANIAAYYPARQIMLEQIATAAKAYSEKLVDEVQIGGVNLLSRHLAFIGSGDFPYLADIPVKPNCTYTYQGFGGLNVYLVIFNSGRKQYNVSQQYATFTTTEKETSVILFFDRTAMNPKPNNLALRVKLEQGNKATDWSPAPEDVQTDISYGKIYLRGAGANRDVVPIIMINGVSILSNYKRGMTLAVLNRLTMETVKVATYDTYGTVDAQKELAAQMAQYDDRNLVILVSFDAIGISTPELKAQITRCGGTQVHFVSIRMPYALLGIPGIGEGNGLEVYTSSAIDAPYAEISTQVINGTPQGIASLSARTANAAKASADAANATIAAMNNDGIFDLAEKQSIRTRWENISGISNTVYDPIPTNGGSYIRIITFAAALSVPTDGLVAAFTGLRTYLHNLDLYTGVNTPDFNRSEMAAKFTTYYDAETALANLVIKQQSLSQGDRDKNEMAQRLGYASYADMVANPTIIDGGYVRAEVIKTEQLIARNLRTGLSGNRVEIIGDDKEIKVFDDAENMCVRVSGSRSSDFVPAANNVYKLLTQKATDSSSGSRIVYAEQDDSNGKQWILFGDTSTRVCQFNKYKNSIVNIPSFTGSLNIHNYLREDINKVSGDHPIEPILNDLTTIINVKILLFHIDAQGSRTLHTTLKDYIYNSTTETPQRPIIPTKAIDTLVGEDGAYEIVLNISRSIVLTNAQSHPQTRIYWNMDAEVLPFYLTTTLDTGPSTSLFSNGLTSWWGADKYFGVLNIPGGDFMRAVCGTSGFKLNADGVQLMAKGAYNNVANNYIRSTDGLMIQWGRSRMLGAPGVVVYFPTAFATTVGLTIMGQILSGATEDQSSFAMRVHPNSIYTTRFTAFGTNVTSDVENWLYSDFMWFAIGRWR